MYWEQQIQYASLSDVGVRRQNNEDACVVRLSPDKETWQQRGHVFVVADGMGGHAVGELASKIAIDTIPHTYFKSHISDVAEALKSAVEMANAAIHERGSQNFDFNRMGTTCVALALCPQGAVIAHVGDSRLYRVRGSRIDQLTCDHSLQWELEQNGRLKPEHLILHDVRHVITRSLGPEETVNVDMTGPLPVQLGDTFLLCSDGLTAHVTDQEIGAIAGRLPATDACRLLVHLANLRGGSDNTTVVIAHVDALPPGVAEGSLEATQETSTVSWKSLLAYWGVAALFAAGILLLFVGNHIEGTALASLSVVLTFALITKWTATQRPPEEQETEGRHGPTTPPRTASAELTRPLLAQLGALASGLQKTAREEGWSLEWAEHDSAREAAREALKAGDYTRTLHELGKSIDTLMASVHAHRKQIVRETRSGHGRGADE